MNESAAEGGCFCGAVRYRVSGLPRTLAYCHCRSCRHAAGAPYVAWATFQTEAFEVLRGTLSTHASSPGVARGFCERCGTPLTYAHSARANEVDITLATLSDPSGFAPQMHLYVKDKLPWVVIEDGLPQYARFKNAAPG